MKKLALIVALIVAVGVAALAIFIVTFDADRYRPLVVSQLQEALGRPVQLERLSLGWRGGIALQVQGLTIADIDPKQPEPLVQVDAASALVRLLPLLKKEVRVASIIFVRPRIHVVRAADGTVNLLGLMAVAGPATAAHQPLINASPVSFNVASLQMADGALHWTNQTVSPPAELWVKHLDVRISHIAPSIAMDIEVSGALGSETSNVTLRANLMPPTATSHGALEHLTLTLHRLTLEQILPAAPTGQPQLHGTLTLQLQGGVPTLESSQITQGLSGSGRLQLSDAVVENLNVVRAVFEKLSTLPGLVEHLQAHLPATYATKLSATNTSLAPIDVSLRLEGGRLQFGNLQLVTDTFHLSGAGTVGLDGAINVRSRLRIEPALSSAIISSVHELKALSNQSGEIEMPVTIQGTAPQVAVLPDLHYVASKVVVTTAVDLLGELLRKERPSEPPPASEAPASRPADLLGTLLHRVLQDNAPSSTQQ